MDDLFLTMKSYEYMARARLASLKGDRDREKKAIGTAVVITRLMARNAVEELKSKRSAVAAAERSWKKAKASGILFPMGERRVEAMMQEAGDALKQLANLGALLSATLDMWQECGATLQELCNLCNRDWRHVAKALSPDRLEEPFSTLVFAYNLDYKDPRNREWIDYDVDAPLSYAVREHMLDLMLHTREGKKASHEALVQCFPVDGTVRFTDKDMEDI